MKKVTAALGPFASNVMVTLEPMQAVLTQANAPLVTLQNAVAGLGKYQLLAPAVHAAAPAVQGFEENTGWFATYRPLLLILAFITSGSVLVQLGQHAGHGMGVQALNAHDTMRYFMAGFFLVFAFFKLLDVEAFANAYAGYDLLAAKWKPWGYAYPYVELALGVLYLANVAPVFTAWATLIVMGFSAVGVIRAVTNKRSIQCACLGTVFKLPMSTVTIVEDVGMVLMAAAMLVLV